jgi:long-chain acyl-CoA synthetase
VARFTAKQVEARAEQLALVDERGATSWKNFDLRVNRLINAMRGAGLVAGDTIAIFAGNCREYYEVMTAAGHCGIVYVPVNWHFTSEELQYVVDDADCKMLVVEGQFQDIAAPVTQAGGVALLRIGVRSDGGLFTDYEAFIDQASDAEPEDQTLGGPMFYTSGTTGRPKGVRSSTQGETVPLEVLEMMGAGMSAMLSIPADGTTFVCGPVYHSAQWAFSFLPLMNGSQIVMRHRFDAAESLQLIDEHEITNVHLVPTQFTRLLRVDDTDKKGFSGQSLQVVWHGAAPCPPEVKRQMIDWWGLVINEYYGSTEGSIVTTATAQEWLDRPGTVGKPSPMVQIKVVDENGQEVENGTSGEIYVKNVMGTDFEYHNEPEKTAAVHLEPGVFTFGDIGYFDDDGYLYLSDRKIDMIISGGVNIYPAEIEGVLANHEQVADVAVFGVPNDEFGEEVKAAVQLVPGSTKDESLRAALIAYCRERLAGYKAPKSIDFVDEMPRYETGKLYKRKLRDPYWEGSGRSI